MMTAKPDCVPAESLTANQSSNYPRQLWRQPANAIFTQYEISARKCPAADKFQQDCVNAGALRLHNVKNVGWFTASAVVHNT